MSRRLAFLVACLLPVVAHAQDAPTPDHDSEEPSSQAIGGRLGAEIGVGGAASGGLRLGGVYLYRLDETTWFDGGAGIVFGSGDAACYLDRDAELVCDHGMFDGFAMHLEGGLRWVLARQPSGFTPHVRAGVALSYVRFSDDDVTGIALSPWGGIGGRFKVANRVHVGGEALIRVGAGRYTRDLDLELLGAIIVQFGVEFEL